MILSAASALLLLISEPASAQDAMLERALAGTIVSTYPNGLTAKLWLNRDGSYKGEGRRGSLSSGRWTLRPGKLCFKQSRPFPVPFSYCTPTPTDISTPWTSRAITGEAIRVQVIAGRA